MKNRRVAVRAIVVHEDKILCVRLKKYQGKATDDGQDYWCTPGGGVDIGEPLVLALEREIVEETGVVPTVGNLLYIQQFQHNDWEHLEFFFHVTNGTDYVNIDLSKTSHGVLEIAEINFIDPAQQTVLPRFLTSRDFIKDIANGATKIFNNF